MMSHPWRGWFVWLCLVGTLSSGQVAGETVALQPSADTAIFAGAPDNNLGTNANFLVGGNGGGFPGRGLIRFDVAGSVPSNAVIQSVTLSFDVVVVAQGESGAQAYNLRRVLADWAEGTGTGNTGSAANPGEVTWNNRIHPSTPWIQPGGAISNEFSPTISASMLLSNVGSYTFASHSNLVADVQQWLLNPATNFGWAMIGESETTPFTARRIASRENIGNEPVLTVQYAPSAAPTIQWIKAINGQIEFSFIAQADQPYTVQYRDSLSSGNWQTFTNVAPQLVTTNLVFVDPFPTNAQRYYHIGNF